MNSQAQEKLRAHLEKLYNPMSDDYIEMGAIDIIKTALGEEGECPEVIPPCISGVIARTIIILEDCMPDCQRTSPFWKETIMDAVHTGMGREKERNQTLLQWVFEKPIPVAQQIANGKNAGPAWKAMTEIRNPQAASEFIEQADIATAGAKSSSDASVLQMLNSTAYTLKAAMLCSSKEHLLEYSAHQAALAVLQVHGALMDDTVRRLHEETTMSHQEMGEASDRISDDFWHDNSLVELVQRMIAA